MTFDHPLILAGAIILIPLIIFEILSRRKRKTFSSELEKKLLASFILFCLFLIFTITALAGPRWGTGFMPFEYRRGLDTVFAIDVSRSMDIRDAQAGGQLYTRLERGLSIAKDCITSVSGARFAAAIGRTRGYLAVPLTFDSETAMIFMETLDGASMTGRSTNLETLLDAAAGAFGDASPARKTIVLISDGESHAGVIRNAINRCVRDGIIINTVAVGSDEGRQILSRSGDPQSPSVISRRDTAVMRIAAERTGGVYIDANREDAAFALSAHLLSLAQELNFQNNEYGFREPKQQRAFFAVLALIAFAASKFVTRQLPRFPPLASIAAVLLFFTSCTQGKLFLMEANYFHSRGRYEEAMLSYNKALNHEDAVPYAEYGLGLTFYSLDQGEAAFARFNNSKNILEGFSAGEHRELRYRNHYNSGIILFEEGDFTSAAASFREALRMDPRKTDAKRNLELSLLSISTQTGEDQSSQERREQRQILFDYLREEEEQFWRSREWTDEEDYSGPDY